MASPFFVSRYSHCGAGVSCPGGGLSIGGARRQCVADEHLSNVASASLLKPRRALGRRGCARIQDPSGGSCGRTAVARLA